MGVLSDHDKKHLKKIFDKDLVNNVEITVFLDDEKNPDTSEIAKAIMEDLVELSDKIKVEFIDARKEEGYKLLKEYRLDLDKWGDRRGPIFIFKNKPGIIYYGLPAGEEFTPFIEDIISISKNEIDISMKAAKTISKIDIPIDVYIFVTPTCPYCPLMTTASHRFAFLNDKIRGIMIEATEFPEMSDHFMVGAVPRNVVIYNSDIVLEWEGALPEATFAEYLEHAVLHAKGEPHEH